jgi:hypothetical protein
MSLILTQSTPGSANSYVNRFKNTFELPPNAQVAVQEVVMNRKASFTVRPNALFFVRHTPDGVHASVHTQIVVTLFEGVYDAEEMAAHIQERLRACDHHPQYQNGWKCVAKLQKQQFHHFVIHAKQLDQDTTASTPAQAEVISSDPAIQYAAATQLVSMVSTNTAPTSFVTMSLPMTNNLGVFSVQIPQLNKGNNRSPAAILWRTHGSINNSANRHMNPNSTAWNDTVFGVTIRHSVRPSDAPSVASTTGTSWIIQPYSAGLYNNRTVVQSSAILSSKIEGWVNNSGYNVLTFEMTNDKLDLFYGTAADTKAANQGKPIHTFFTVGTYAYALTPALVANHHINYKILEYRNVAAYNYDAINTQVVSNPYMDRSLDRAVVSTIYSTLNGDYLNLRTTLLMGNSGAVGANTSGMLGYNDVQERTAKNPGNEFFEAQNDPEVTLNDNMYVRLTGLTFESQNGTSGGPSRIIQPLARFTDNKTHGYMHFVPPQRTYLKLRNPSKITVQEIQVDIVNAEETVVGDLLDTTYVSLHIK